ncbi:hypothetical protein ACFL2C_03065 [Patescibacteria group bacterium]
MNAHKNFLKTSIIWGFVLWLIGYLLGFVFFMVVPPELIGWAITPIGIAITLWVLGKRIHSDELGSYFKLGLVWTLMAVVLDYMFIVKMLVPEDGYYKLDVYLYYLFTLALPLLVGWMKKRNKKEKPKV